MLNNSYDIGCYLPYVDFKFNTPIVMGPVLLVPAYQVEAKSVTIDPNLVKTQTGTILISRTIPKDNHTALIVDAIYLLYFASVFDELYLNHTYLPFNPFTYIVPVENSQTKATVKHAVDSTLSIPKLNAEVCRGLGLALQTMYSPQLQGVKTEEFQDVRRIIRSIRFFVDRFFDKFHNVLNENTALTEELFEPENILFLATSFETLFHVSAQYPQADFKQKLRPLLHLKHSKPIDIFWKWADGFYHLRHKIVLSGEVPDENFRVNENFILPYSFYGIKLFIYSVYYRLFKMKLVSSGDEETYYPPHFKWLFPEEILIYLWPEKELLMQISLLSKQVIANPQDEELAVDLTFLSGLYEFLFNRYMASRNKVEHAIFIPTQMSVVEGLIREILNYQEQKILIKNELTALKTLEPPSFSDILQRRLLL